MPDISMCHGAACAIRDRCYRFTAKPNEWQSYADFDTNSGRKCEFFWPAEGEMPKVTIEFDQYEEAESLGMALKATRAFTAIEDFRYWIRQQQKHGTASHVSFDELGEKFFEIFEDVLD